MQVRVSGEVVKVEPRAYVAKDGQQVQVFDAYLRASDPTKAADRISGPRALMPAVGDEVEYLADVVARSGQWGAYLSCQVSEQLAKV